MLLGESSGEEAPAGAARFLGEPRWGRCRGSVGGAPGSVVVSAARPAVEHCGTLGGGAAWVLGPGRGVKRSASNLHILRYLLDIQGEMSIRI